MFDTKLLTDNGVNLAKSLELFGDIATYNDNLDEFISGVESLLIDLSKYKEVADMNNYAIRVHSLKSDAKYFGFEHLAELAYNHEMKSKDNDMYYIYDNYDELVEEINRITRLIKEYMGWDYEKNVAVQESETIENGILVVDDSNIISNFITKVFNNEYKVLTAKDGQDAIDILSGRIDEIKGMLLDLNMPNVDGYGVLKFMATNDCFKKVSVAIITGTDSAKVIEMTKGYPIKAILEKPFNEANVKRVVEMIVKE